MAQYHRCQPGPSASCRRPEAGRHSGPETSWTHRDKLRWNRKISVSQDLLPCWVNYDAVWWEHSVSLNWTVPAVFMMNISCYMIYWLLIGSSFSCFLIIFDIAKQTNEKQNKSFSNKRNLDDPTLIHQSISTEVNMSIIAAIRWGLAAFGCHLISENVRRVKTVASAGFTTAFLWCSHQKQIEAGQSPARCMWGVCLGG